MRIASQTNPPFLWRWCRRVLLLLLCLLLLVSGTIVGGFFWLDSEKGEQFVLHTVLPVANEALQAQGLRLEASGFSGPLPVAASLQGVRLYDSQGLFLEAGYASVRLTPGSLISRDMSLDINEILLNKPVLHRLPQLPPAQPSEDPPILAPAVVHLELPIALRVQSVRVVGGLVPQGLIIPAAPDPQGNFAVAALPEGAEGSASPASPNLSLELTATANLEKGQLVASATLQADAMTKGQELVPGVTGGVFTLENLQADLSNPAGNAAAIQARLSLFGKKEQRFALELRANHSQEALRLTELRLEGLGLLAEASGHWLWNREEGQGQFSLAGEEAARWQDMVVQLTGVDRAMVEAVGFPLVMSAQVATSGTEARVTIDHLQAGGIEGSGAVQLQLGNAIAGEGRVQLAIADLGPFTPAENRISGPLSLSLHLAPGSTVAGHEGMGAGQQIALSFESPRLETVAGVLETLKATVEITVANTEEGLAATGSLQASARENTVGKAVMQGDWQFFWPVFATGAEAPAMQELRANAGKPAVVGFSGLNMEVFGLRVMGDLVATIAADILQQKQDDSRYSDHSAASASTGHSGSFTLPPGLFLEGTVTTRVQDWQPLAALAGMRMSGTGTTVSARFTPPVPGRSGQGVALDARIDSFDVPDNNLSINALTARVEATMPADTPGAIPALRLDVRTGQGKAGEIAWREAVVTAGGNGPQGAFSATVKQAARENRRAQRATQSREGGYSRATFGNKEEMLNLSGAYNWQSRVVSMQTATVQMPPNIAGGIGLRLRQPVQLLLADGFSLQNIMFDCYPGGSIQASVQGGTAGLEASAKIAAVPTEFLQRLGVNGIPNGRFDAEFTAKIDPAGQNPSARLLAEVRLAEKSSVVESGGVVRMRTLADGTIRTRNIPASGSDPASGKAAGEGTSPRHGLPSLDEKADIRLEAAIVRSGGRAFLAGGLDVLPAPMEAAAPRFPGQPYTEQPGAVLGGTQAESQGAPISFQIPLQISDGGLPLPDLAASSHIAVRWKGRLEQLWHFVPLPDTRASGQLFLDLALNGPLTALQVGGSAYMADGRFWDKVQSVLLTDITVEARAANRHEYSIVASASDGNRGTLGLEGTLSLADAPVFTLRGQARNMAPLHRDDIFIAFSGIFAANGPVASPAVTATVLVERGEVTLASSQGSAGVQVLEIANAKEEAVFDTGPVATCDITVQIPGRFFVRGFGLDSEWQGTLHVDGPLAEPELTGTLTPIRGNFELLSKPFVFSGGGIEFVGGTRLNPGLNLELVYAGSGDIEAVIIASGTLENPELELQSRPPLPQDEILARVLFGKKVSELSRFEALQLANSMRELSGIGGGGVPLLANMRTAVGLDVLRLGSGSGGATQRQSSGLAGEGTLARQDSSGTSGGGAPSVEAGKYLNDSIYIGVEQGATPESTGVRVEVELFPSVTVQGRTGASSNQAGIGWKMDY